jgi:chromatin segregation and condensation protein Rec8/ScpA/Scc1 (kleisin family)
MLELIKRRIVVAAQPALFGDIELSPTDELMEEEADDEIEFID